jgi:peroxiredoxin
MTGERLGIGSDFPEITLTDIDNNNITIPDDIKTRYCILLFIRGAW